MSSTRNNALLTEFLLQLQSAVVSAGSGGGGGGQLVVSRGQQFMLMGTVVNLGVVITAFATAVIIRMSPMASGWRQEIMYQTCRSTPGVKSIAAWRRKRRAPLGIKTWLNKNEAKGIKKRVSFQDELDDSTSSIST